MMLSPTLRTLTTLRRRSPLVGLALTVFLVAVQCGAAPAPQMDADETVAKVGEKTIERGELMAEAESRLESVELQKLQCETNAAKQSHDVLQFTLEQLVRESLETAAAEQAGEDRETWVAAQKAAHAEKVTEAQIDQLIASNQQLQRQPKERIVPQIRNYLGEQSFYEELKAAHDVEYLLEPYRLAVDEGNGPTKGGEAAPVTIIEFSDFECPYCKRVNPTIEQTLANYGDKVQIVFRQFPLESIHPNALKAAEASLCARDQGKFWEMHDLMFEEQGKLAVADLKEKAARLELDTETFDQCLDSGRYEPTVRDDLRAGAIAGVSGTPAFFVNGRPLSGALSPETLAAVIDDELERAEG